MIVIQGAGITGLTLAGLLETNGRNYRLVEQSPALRPVGAGLVLQRNALAVLATLPEADIEAVSAPIDRMVIGNADRPDLHSMTLDHATRSRGIHRADLQQFLLAQIDESRLQLGTSVSDWKNDPDGLQVRLSSGETIRASHLIGADGIGSGIRAALAGPAVVRGSHQWCARTVIDGQPAGSNALEIHAGRHRLGMVPLARGRSYVFWVQSRHDDAPIPAGEIEAAIGRMGQPGRSIVRHLSPRQSWLQHPLTDIPVLWGRERILLIGDAAHALTPNLGQGAALGIEDALVLTGLILTDAASPAREMAKARHARVRNVRSVSRLMGRIAHIETPMLRKLKDRLLESTSSDRGRTALGQWLDRAPEV